MDKHKKPQTQPHNKTPQTKHNGLLPRHSCQLFSSFLTLQNLVENLLNPGLKQDSTCILQDITCIWWGYSNCQDRLSNGNLTLLSWAEAGSTGTWKCNMMGKEVTDIFQNSEIQSEFLAKFWVGYFSWQTSVEFSWSQTLSLIKKTLPFLSWKL